MNKSRNKIAYTLITAGLAVAFSMLTYIAFCMDSKIGIITMGLCIALTGILIHE